MWWRSAVACRRASNVLEQIAVQHRSVKRRGLTEQQRKSHQRDTGCNQFVGRTHEVPAARDGEGGLERMQRNVDEKRKWTSEAFEHQAVVGAVSRGGVPASHRKDKSFQQFAPICSPALQQKQKLQDNFRSWGSFA